jgi:hypothetical protein
MKLTIVAVFMSAVLAWAGGDPWKGKPYSQWTEQDVTEVMQASPWAKRFTPGNR